MKPSLGREVRQSLSLIGLTAVLVTLVLALGTLAAHAGA